MKAAVYLSPLEFDTNILFLVTLPLEDVIAAICTGVSGSATHTISLFCPMMSVFSVLNLSVLRSSPKPMDFLVDGKKILLKPPLEWRTHG